MSTLDLWQPLTQLHEDQRFISLPGMDDSLLLFVLAVLLLAVLVTLVCLRFRQNVATSDTASILTVVGSGKTYSYLCMQNVLQKTMRHIASQ